MILHQGLQGSPFTPRPLHCIPLSLSPFPSHTFQEGPPHPPQPCSFTPGIFFSSLQGAELPRRKMQSPKGTTSSNESALQRKVFYSCRRGCFKEPPFVSSKAAKGGDQRWIQGTHPQAAAAEISPSPGLCLASIPQWSSHSCIPPHPISQGSTCSCTQPCTCSTCAGCERRG